MAKFRVSRSVIDQAKATLEENGNWDDIVVEIDLDGAIAAAPAIDPAKPASAIASFAALAAVQDVAM